MPNLNIPKDICSEFKLITGDEKEYNKCLFDGYYEWKSADSIHHATNNVQSHCNKEIFIRIDINKLSKYVKKTTNGKNSPIGMSNMIVNYSKYLLSNSTKNDDHINISENVNNIYDEYPNIPKKYLRISIYAIKFAKDIDSMDSRSMLLRHIKETQQTIFKEHEPTSLKKYSRIDGHDTKKTKYTSSNHFKDNTSSNHFKDNYENNYKNIGLHSFEKENNNEPIRNNYFINDKYNIEDNDNEDNNNEDNSNEDNNNDDNIEDNIEDNDIEDNINSEEYDNEYTIYSTKFYKKCMKILRLLICIILLIMLILIIYIIYDDVLHVHIHQMYNKIRASVG